MLLHVGKGWYTLVHVGTGITYQFGVHIGTRQVGTQVGTRLVHIGTGWYMLVGTRAKSVISRHPSGAGPSIRLAITIKALAESAGLLCPPSLYSLFHILICVHTE